MVHCYELNSTKGLSSHLCVVLWGVTECEKCENVTQLLNGIVPSTPSDRCDVMGNILAELMT